MIGILKGMAVTFKHILRRRFTVQYPDEKLILAPRYRGALKLRGVIGEERDGAPFSEEMPPCQTACPAHVDVRGYVGLIAQKRFTPYTWKQTRFQLSAAGFAPILAKMIAAGAKKTSR